MTQDTGTPTFCAVGMYNLQEVLHLGDFSISTVLQSWIQPTTNPVVLQYLLLKKVHLHMNMHSSNLCCSRVNYMQVTHEKHQLRNYYRQQFKQKIHKFTKDLTETQLFPIILYEELNILLKYFLNKNNIFEVRLIHEVQCKKKIFLTAKQIYTTDKPSSLINRPNPNILGLFFNGTSDKSYKGISKILPNSWFRFQIKESLFIIQINAFQRSHCYPQF